MIDNYTGSINPNRSVFSPSSGQNRPSAGYGSMYAPYGAQQSFDDNYRPLGQKAAMDLGRAATQAQGQYYNQAADVQNRGALQGLRLLGQQRDNAYERQNAEQDMQFKWMRDLMGGGLLGGLL